MKYYVAAKSMAMDVGSWIGKEVPEMEDAEAVVFTGGADISPELYGEKPHPLTRPYQTRDKAEVHEFKRALAMGKKLIGICRGAQLLCALAGGKLVQHQENRGNHIVHLPRHKNAEGIYVTSCHHQAQFPWLMNKDDFRLYGYSVFQSSYHQGADEKEMLFPNIKEEVEDVYYPKIQALAIQGHPEWLALDHPTIVHYQKMVAALKAGDL